MKKYLIFIFILLVFFSFCSKNATRNLKNGLYAEINTDKGEIIIQLEYKKAPMTVANFVGLAEGTIKNTFRKEGEPFFDGLKFHRVVKGFVIQGGDPNGNGNGGPGYEFPNEISPDLKHDSEGIVAMANAGPDTNGSQFYITLSSTPHLDGKYSIFGKVVEGMDVVKSIKKGDVIKSIKILRIGKDVENYKVSDDMFKKLVEKSKKAKIESFMAKYKRDMEKVKEKWPNAIKTDSGLMYVVLKKGNGKKPKKGQDVVVHYTGMFVDGRIFDSSINRNKPFEFKVGVGKVIKGWDEALLDMRKGEERIIILPPEIAYGEKGAGNGVIPPMSILVFNVKLLDIK